jgi:hypothetical protein
VEGCGIRDELIAETDEALDKLDHINTIPLHNLAAVSNHPARHSQACKLLHLMSPTGFSK